MQSETTELKLLKRLYSRVTPRSLYGLTLSDVINSDNKEKHLRLILDFYSDFKFPQHELCVQWGDKLINDLLIFVETNPDLFQKVLSRKHLCLN